MPIYEYKCKCGHSFEDLCSFDEADKVKCEKCKKKAQRQIPSRQAFIFDNVKSTSKWDNFDYRAQHNMEKAKEERRAAELASKESPYKEIDDTNLPGVFGKDGVDPEGEIRLEYT